MKTNSPSSQVYKTTSALGKAIAKAKQGLPNSPNHKAVVVKKLFSSECHADLSVGFKPSNKDCCWSKSLSDTTLKKIQDFYKREDISRTAPGRKDVVTIWEHSIKSKKQAHHLICSLKEVF